MNMQASITPTNYLVFSRTHGKTQKLGRVVKTFIYDISVPAKGISMDMSNIKTYNNNIIIIISAQSNL